MESDFVLRLQRVSHVFHRGTPNEVRALDRVDLDLARGSFTVVLGTNGSGKSTLLGAVAGSRMHEPGPHIVRDVIAVVEPDLELVSLAMKRVMADERLQRGL